MEGQDGPGAGKRAHERRGGGGAAQPQAKGQGQGQGAQQQQRKRRRKKGQGKEAAGGGQAAAGEAPPKGGKDKGKGRRRTPKPAAAAAAAAAAAGAVPGAADSQQYNVSKRPAQRLPSRKNDLYVTRKSSFASQMERAQKLLDSGFAEVHIHGLGAAINRAINVALQLQARSCNALLSSVQTGTVPLVDDLVPSQKGKGAAAGAAAKAQTRNNSCVHITLRKAEAVAHVPTA